MTTFNDHARAISTAITQIIRDALESGELRLKIEAYLRDELADVERQIAADRKDCS